MSALGKIALKGIEKKALEHLAKEGEMSILKSPDLRFNRLASGLTKLALTGEKFVPHLINEAKSKLSLQETKDYFAKNDVKSNEIPFKGSIEKEFPWSDVIGNYNSINEINNSLIKSETENEMLKIERHPAKLPADISERLIIDHRDINNETWAKATVEERLEMLNKAFKVMCEEEMIPQDMIDKAKVTSFDFNDGSNEYTHAACNSFLGINENGQLYVKDNINININELTLKNPNCDFYEVLSSLYHESIHAMQQVSLCEGGKTFTYAEMQEEWRKDVISRLINGEPSSASRITPFTEYATSSMETYAHMQTDYFKTIFMGMECEVNDAIMEQALDSMGFNKLKPISTNLITIPEELTGRTQGKSFI